ncbi:MAG: holin family protein [Pseudomonadota bacterium]
MGIVGQVFSTLFGGERNIIRETAEVFIENAEAGADRQAAFQQAALQQFAAEFGIERRGVFDRFIDGVNRLPRPLLALGTLGLLISALVDPVWFAQRMQGIALVPQPLWWLMGAIVSFYFGARHQVKTQEFQRSIAASLARTPKVTANIAALRALEAGAEASEVDPEDANPALDDWRHRDGH